MQMQRAFIDTKNKNYSAYSLNNNNFGYKILNKICNNDTCLSAPVSLYYLLQLIYIGCSGKSRDELAQVLNQTTDNDVSIISEFMKEINKDSHGESGLHLTNGIFIDNKHRDSIIKSHYNVLMKKLGQIDYLDFSKIQSIDKINKFFKKVTHNLVENVLTIDDVDSTTSLILINTIYFKRDWVHKFELTEYKQPFTNLRGQTTFLPTMNKTAHYDYYENEKLQIISLKYIGDTYAMDIFLPIGFGKGNLEHVIQEFQNYDLNTILINLEIDCILPVFTQRVHLNMVDILKELGVEHIFDPQLSDFTNTGVKSLYVSKIIQDIAIIVDTNGTEASGQTTAVMKSRDFEINKIFKADHSFLYQIRNLKNGLILFNGIFDGFIDKYSFINN